MSGHERQNSVWLKIRARRNQYEAIIIKKACSGTY